VTPVPDEPLPPRARAGAYALVLLLTLLLAVWGAFLVPLKAGTIPVPVSWVVAGVGNAALGLAAGRLYARQGVLGTGVLWLAVALTLGTKRDEGDLVVPGDVVGLLFLLIGAVGSAVAYGLVPRAAPPA
jgi:hypothetical protein